MPKTIAEVDTPAMLVDVSVVDKNLQAAQEYADKHGVRLRPHIKTHKLPHFALQQLEKGAVGINCQKVSEAETMVDSMGVPDLDVLITFNVIGATKLERLTRLASRCTLTVVADSEYSVKSYAAAAEAAGVTISVMIECDTGGKRAGVTEPIEALKLAKLVLEYGSMKPSAVGEGKLSFSGLMTYPGPIEPLKSWLDAVTALFASSGIRIGTITVGGTPDMWRIHELLPHVTEMRPGTYIYNDRAIMRSNAARLENCAQTVLATVVSRPTPHRAICDAGSKALSSDLLGLEGNGLILGFPGARVARLSEEHGVIEADSPEDLPQIGDRIQIVPNHACVVTNLFDEAYLIDGEKVVRTLPISARGKMQ